MSAISVAALDLMRGRIDTWEPTPPVLDTADLPSLARALGRPVNVAVARLDGIGDWILTLPLVLSLRASDSVASTSLVAAARHRGLLGAPQREPVIGLEGLTILDPPSPGGALGKVMATSAVGQRRAWTVGLQHAGEWDAVILPRWDTDLGQNARAWAAGTGTALLGFDPRVRADVTRSEAAEARLMSDPLADAHATAHELEHTRALSVHLGLADHVLPGYGLEYFEVERGEGGPIAMHVSSMEPKRRWPVDHWRTLAHTLVSQGHRVVLVGGPEDASLHRHILDGLGAAGSSAAGKTKLRDLPAELASAQAFIGNDSGPMHLAASLGLPTVAVSPHPIGGDDAHRNSPTRFGPRGTSTAVVRPLEGKGRCSASCVAHRPHCIGDVSPQRVLEAFNTVYQG